MKKVTAIALAALVGPSCQPGPFQSPPIEAEFRWQAREMYESLRKPSCEAPRSFDRAELLKAEYQAVRSLEQQTQATRARLHLQLASEDAAFEQAKDEGCWMEYSELIWAEKHLEMTKEDVRGRIARLRTIAPLLHESLPNGTATAGNAPEFRYFVRQLVQFSRPQCLLTTMATNDRVMEPARHEIGRFRDSLEGTPYADNFDAAQADVAYELSITMVECATPSQTEPKLVSQGAVADVRRQVAALGRLVQSR